MTERICIEEGCEKPRKGPRAKCSMHHARDWRAKARLRNPPPLVPTDLEYFNARTPERGDGCWMWQGNIGTNGYGWIVRSDDRPGGKRIYAHRWSYEHHIGPIPEGHLIRHSCDNPPCVNPAHLSTGTRLDNARDMVDRGRALTGLRAPGARFTAEEIAEVRRLRAEGISGAEIARRFGMSQSHVSHVVNWRVRRTA